MKRKFILGCLMLMMPLIGRAEKDDVGFWLSAEVEKKLSKK